MPIADELVDMIEALSKKHEEAWAKVNSSTSDYTQHKNMGKAEGYMDAIRMLYNILEDKPLEAV